MSTEAEDQQRDFVKQWRDPAYNCFSSGHKFCRNVCPVMQVTQNENHSPTAFHANIVAMEQGALTVADVAEDYVHCTQCGACELRCPNTLMAGEFYRARTRTVDVVKAMRAWPLTPASNSRTGNAGSRRPSTGRTSRFSTYRSHRRMSRTGPTDSVSVSAARPCCSSTAKPRSTGRRCRARWPRSCRRVGSSSDSMREQWCCGGPAAEMGYVARSREFAVHNVDDWRSIGASRIITLDPHDYITFTEDYPKYFGDEYEFEIVHITELVAELIREGKLSLTVPIERVATYHDPCRLNKRKGIHKSPREILRAIPGWTSATSTT